MREKKQIEIPKEKIISVNFLFLALFCEKILVLTAMWMSLLSSRLVRLWVCYVWQGY